VSMASWPSTAVAPSGMLDDTTPLRPLLPAAVADAGGSGGGGAAGALRGGMATDGNGADVLAASALVGCSAAGVLGPARAASRISLLWSIAGGGARGVRDGEGIREMQNPQNVPCPPFPLAP